MRISNIVAPSAVTSALAAITIAAASTASALPTTAGFGARQSLVDGGGIVVTGWTVNNIRPSSDVIPFPVAGKLWEATATVDAQQGTVAPIVSDFNARAANGQTYRVLAHVATPQGVNPAPLGQGARETGKLYFDVVGPAPNSVVYNDGVQDILIWS